LGVIVAALVAGAAYLSGPDQQYVLDLADDWNHRIEEWTYVHDSWLDTIFGLAGHYVRVGPDPHPVSPASRTKPTPSSTHPVPGSSAWSTCTCRGWACATRRTTGSPTPPD